MLSEENEDGGEGSAAAGKVPSASSPNRDREIPAPSKIKRLKILTVGDASVGKSCLIKRFCEGRFISDYIATIGIDYGVKAMSLRGHKVHIDFWDTAGDELFLEVRNEFYCRGGESNAPAWNAMLLVFDVNNGESFGHLENWIQEVIGLPRIGDVELVPGGETSGDAGAAGGTEASDGHEKIIGIVVGNKVDSDEGKRKVSREEASEWAKINGFAYFETSAKTGQGVEEAFNHLFEISYKPIN